jgi:hypothetical protein
MQVETLRQPKQIQDFCYIGEPPGEESFSVCFGSFITIESPFMAIAIISQYTPEGFALGADGRRCKHPSGELITDKAKKVFSIRGKDSALAFAFAGTTEIPRGDGTIAFSFITACLEAAREIGQSDTVFVDITAYVMEVMEAVYKKFVECKGSGALSEYFLHPNSPKIELKGLFLGFYGGRPTRAEVKLNYAAQTPEERAVLTRLQTSNSDLRFFEVFSGSQTIIDRIRNRADAAFARYRTPAVENEQPLQSLSEAVQLIGNCIGAFIANQEVDSQCRQIGGHIHIAKITESKGFEWIIPPLGDPRDPDETECVP